MVLDCEYLDGIFIPFDLIYYNDEDINHLYFYYFYLKINNIKNRNRKKCIKYK